jgi:lipopolysaccharide biosynthesis protein
VRSLHERLRPLIDVVRASVGHLRRLRSQVRSVRPGADPAAGSKRAAVYVHYDPQGRVHDYVIHQLRELQSAGLRVTFVTNAPKFGEASVAKVVPFCRHIIWRRNVGYDLGAYKDGIAAIGDVSGLTCLLLMNDSVYGPFRPLAEVLRAAEAAHADIWGITDSLEFDYHVQTYFIVFLERALRSPAFARFWRRMPYVNDRFWVVRKGEIKLTPFMIGNGLKVGVLCPYRNVAAAVRRTLEAGEPATSADADRSFRDGIRRSLTAEKPLNPMHHFWDALIADFECPFIKRELICTNPFHVPSAERWGEVIGQASAYDLDLIRRHLQAIGFAKKSVP